MGSAPRPFVHSPRAAHASKSLQLFRLEAHVLVLGDLVPFHRLFAGHDAVDRTLQTHLDPAAAPRMEQVEGDPLRAGGGEELNRSGEELNRNGGQAQRDIEVLQCAASSVQRGQKGVETTDNAGADLFTC